MLKCKLRVGKAGLGFLFSQSTC